MVLSEHPNQQQQQQQQKRRRFHPLRNLRRIFRRRTINSSTDSPASCQSPGPGSCNTLPPPASSSSEKNLRSGIASPTGSPLNPQQLKENYQTQSLPKSKSYGSHRDELLSVLLGKKRASKQDHSQVAVQPDSQAQSQSPQEAMYQAQRQHGGVAVFPDSLVLNRSSYFAEQRIQQRHLRSVGDSSQELESSLGLGSGSGSGSGAGGAADISDSQRSLSEGRLLDVDG